MKIASISNFRKDIRRYVDEIDQDQEPLVVTRSDNVSVVVIPLSTFNSYSETDYLLRSPANARRLLRSLKDAHAGNVKAHALTQD
jgi:antitoxin YefM